MAEEPEVLGVDDGRADEVISALSSGTARGVLRKVGEESSTASELSRKLDTSIQNVHHHLKRLESAGLIGVEDTRRSPKGNQMKVYAASGSPVVVLPVSGEEGLELKDLIKRFLASIGVLGVFSVGVEILLRWFSGLTTPRVAHTTMESGDAPTPSSTPVPETGQELGRGALEVVDATSPGAMFFLGGLAVLVAYFTWRYRRA